MNVAMNGGDQDELFTASCSILYSVSTESFLDWEDSEAGLRQA